MSNSKAKVIGGAMAGVVTISVTFPIDIIKCKMQADNLKNPLYHNIKECYTETV